MTSPEDDSPPRAKVNRSDIPGGVHSRGAGPKEGEAFVSFQARAGALEWPW